MWYQSFEIPAIPTLHLKKLSLQSENLAANAVVTTCTTFHSIVNGDTCYDIASANNLSLLDFFSINSQLNDNACNNLQIGDLVCVASTLASNQTPQAGATQQTVSQQTCATRHVVANGDTCYFISQLSFTSLDELFALNPTLNLASCDNLFIGQNICVPNPAPLNGQGTPSVPRETSAIQSTPAPNQNSAPAQKPETITCNVQHRVRQGETCASLTRKFNLKRVENFLAVNPSITLQDCANLRANEIVCVSGLINNPSPESQQVCATSYFVKANQNCDSMSIFFQISLPSFLALNPQINPANCNRLKPGTRVCVVRNPPVIPGQIIPTPKPQFCAESYAVKNNQNCNTISQHFGISIQDIIAFNPSPNNDFCLNIIVGQYICVRRNLNVQIPAKTSCPLNYVVLKGQKCTDVIAANHMTLQQLLDINPTLNDRSCNILAAGQRLCVLPFTPAVLSTAEISKTVVNSATSLSAKSFVITSTLQQLNQAITTITSITPSSTMMIRSNSSTTSLTTESVKRTALVST